MSQTGDNSIFAASKVDLCLCHCDLFGCSSFMFCFQWCVFPLLCNISFSSFNFTEIFSKVGVGELTQWTDYSDAQRTYLFFQTFDPAQTCPPDKQWAGLSDRERTGPFSPCLIDLPIAYLEDKEWADFFIWKIKNLLMQQLNCILPFRLWIGICVLLPWFQVVVAISPPLVWHCK